MDTTDRSDSRLPAPFRAASPVLPKPVVDRDLAITPSPQFDSRIIIRGLVRYWWCILGLWVLVSAPIVYLIYAAVEPTYEAISRIRIEPAQHTLYDPINPGATDLRSYEPYLQTQVELMMSDQVLNRAIASVSKLPMIIGSEDAKTLLREKMVVEIVPNAYIIKLSLESKNPAEAAAVINAVVETYLDENMTYTQGRDTNLKKSLELQLQTLKEQIDRKRTELQELHSKGAVQLKKPELNLNPGRDGDGEAKPLITSITEPQLNALMGQMAQVDVDLLTADADLRARLAIQAGEQDAKPQVRQDAPNLEKLVEQEFYRDQDVSALSNEIEKFKDEVNRLKHLARKSTDRALQAAQQQLAKLQTDWNDLWNDKSAGIRQRLRSGIDNRSSPESLATINTLQAKVSSLKEKKAALASMYEQMTVERRQNNDESFRFAYAQRELDNLLNRENQVNRNLHQVEFQSRQEQYRVLRIDKAEIPKVPSHNKRFKYMAVAPLGVLVVMLGLFLLLEIKAGRVANPDALESCVRSQVYALPPLPTQRELRRRSEPTVDEQIEQFISRLDHLRFAVCGKSVQTGKGRCVLITSAIEKEGKTTLAAQLAARCGKAGISTLLIDADLRRGKLPKVLDVPDDLGLSDVLNGASAIDDVVIPVQGGAFSLLSAGTPVRNNNALLESQRFEMLVARLRQNYDLIIIDCPPVLPVPDALILGRWTDGAVLVARYDISRFPQVERARRMLDSAGITVLGTVINGMRNSDSYYGRYSYSRQRSPDSDSSNTT
jgi:polysaccharide biosynthesis transport protein